MELEMEFESNENLEILDAGIEQEDLIGPDLICCWGAFAPFRM